MGVPKGRRTKSKQGHRRSHHALGKKHPSACKRCGEPVMPHRACMHCGSYKGRQVVDVFKDLSKKERKQKEEELTQA